MFIRNDGDFPTVFRTGHTAIALPAGERQFLEIMRVSGCVARRMLQRANQRGHFIVAMGPVCRDVAQDKTRLIAGFSSTSSVCRRGRSHVNRRSSCGHAGSCIRVNLTHTHFCAGRGFKSRSTIEVASWFMPEERLIKCQDLSRATCPMSRS